jgi:NADPH:quinone reductase-like Zn-dependent oxidoreductase
VRILTIK